MNYDLTEQEEIELIELRQKYQKARSIGDFNTSDKLRTELAARGCYGANYDKWLPCFELPRKRQERIERRK